MFCAYFILLLLTNLHCLQLRAYYLGEFGRKLKLELHCITSQVITYQCKLRNNWDGDFDLHDSAELFIGMISLNFFNWLDLGKDFHTPK